LQSQSGDADDYEFTPLSGHPCSYTGCSRNGAVHRNRTKGVDIIFIITLLSCGNPQIPRVDLLHPFDSPFERHMNSLCDYIFGA